MIDVGLMLNQASQDTAYLLALTSADVHVIVESLRLYTPPGPTASQIKGNILAVLVNAQARQGEA